MQLKKGLWLFMEKERDARNIDFGLSITYNRDKYVVLFGDIVKEYSVGSMICEYCRLKPTEIKNVIMSCTCLDSEPTIENLGKFFDDFCDRLKEKFDLIIVIMILVEFLELVYEWYDNKEQYSFKNLHKHNDEISDYIFSNSGYDNCGDNTILQLILSMYILFGTIYSTVKYTFLNINQYFDDTNEKNINAFLKMYTEYIEYQNIDYRIINTEYGFESLYTIKSSMSLLLFEISNSMNNDVDFVKCPNCDMYFVPNGRKDTLYCSYTSPQNSNKTCSEIGAQIIRKNKEKTDVTVREYRKAYMRCRARAKRGVYNKAANLAFKNLTEENKIYKDKFEKGLISADEYINWLKRF